MQVSALYRKKRLKVFLKAKRDVLKLLPAMLRKRRDVQAMKRISNEELTGLLTPVWTKGYLGVRLRRGIDG
jgi:hypothetical protein